MSLNNRRRRLTGVSVLIVEDDADTLELFDFVLRAEGASVVPAASVQQALEAVQQQTPDVVVSDLMLPGADGTSLIARLRSTRGHAAAPAIAVTGHPDLRRALDAGFDEVLAKPVEPTELCAAIERVLSRSGYGDQAHQRRAA